MVKSEFGKGMTYCIGMFLAHEERIRGELEIYEKIGDKKRAYQMWFYGATDHLIEFQIQETLPETLKKRLFKFQMKMLNLRLPMKSENEATEKDFEWAIKEARTLLRLIDKANGVDVAKADWD